MPKEGEKIKNKKTKTLNYIFTNYDTPRGPPAINTMRWCEN
jgi:hypothetical protein